MKNNSFEQAISVIDQSILPTLERLPNNIKDNTQEIRLRINKPLTITNYGKQLFVDKFGNITSSKSQQLIYLSKSHLYNTFLAICNESIHSHQKEIMNGFVTIKGGHRCGICGTAVYDDIGQSITTIKDISSINIRVAHQIIGASSQIIKDINFSQFKGLLICGLPSSGKTTILRDISRVLSSGEYFEPQKIAIVDERSEISATYYGENQSDIGLCCDVLNCYPKDVGIVQAIRVLSPNYIICDEIGTNSDLASVIECASRGVKTIATLHCESYEQLKDSQYGKEILKSQSFSDIIFLDNGENVGKVKQHITIN